MKANMPHLDRLDLLPFGVLEDGEDGDYQGGDGVDDGDREVDNELQVLTWVGSGICRHGCVWD